MRAAVFISLGALTAQAAPDVIGFQKTVQPFLESYCLDCHDNETQEGKLSLEDLRPTMTEGERQTAKRLIAKRNVKRLDVFREAGSLKEDIVSALDGRSGLRARRDAAAAGVDQ